MPSVWSATVRIAIHEPWKNLLQPLRWQKLDEAAVPACFATLLLAGACKISDENLAGYQKFPDPSGF